MEVTGSPTFFSGRWKKCLLLLIRFIINKSTNGTRPPQQQAQQQMQQQEAQRQFEEQKKALIAQILTTEARSRLANLKLTKPELVNQIEIQLIQSAQAGSLRGKVTDEQLKVLLRQIAGQKREIKITRK